MAANLKYKHICITGTLNLMTRDDAMKEIIKAGAFFDKQVTNSTNYLVIGDDPGATKVNKAKKCYTTILTEKQFIDIIYDKPSIFTTTKPVKTNTPVHVPDINLESRDW